MDLLFLLYFRLVLRNLCPFLSVRPAYLLCVSIFYKTSNLCEISVKAERNKEQIFPYTCNCEL
jgi:hypothetical protein